MGIPNSPAGSSGRGRIADHNRWIHAPDPETAFDRLEVASCKAHMTWSEPWQHDPAFDMNLFPADVKPLGLQETVWALMLLWRHTTDQIITGAELQKGFSEGKKDQSCLAIARALFREGKPSHPHEYEHDDAKRGITNFIKATALRLIKPAGALAGHVPAQVEERIRAALTEKVAQQDSQSAYFHMVARLGLTADSFQAPKETAKPAVQSKATAPADDDLNLLPEGIRQYLGEEASRIWPNSTEITRLGEEKVYGHLINGVEEKRLVVLTGPAHAGKTAVLVSLLRKLDRGSTGHPQLPLIVKGDLERLPVLMVNAQRTGYRDLLLETLAFLQRLQNPEKSAETYLEEARRAFAGQGMLDGIPDILKQIGQLHEKHPALLIYTDWQDFSPDQNRTLLRDAPKAELIKLLYDTNATSRIVLSALPNVANTDRTIGLPQPQFEELNAPYFHEITRYFDKDKRPDQEAEPWVTVFQDSLEHRIPGGLLLLAAATYQLCEAKPDDASDVVAATARCCRAINGDAPEGAADELISILLRELKARKVLGMFFVVAASDDGVRTRSLDRIFRRWGKANPASDAPPLIDRLRSFRVLRRLAIRFFLKYEKCTNFDSNEFDFGERCGPHDRVWEVDHAVAEMVADAICRAEAGAEDPFGLAEHADLFRQARRQLADFARWRAQTRRLRTSTLAEPRNIRLMRRDMQCHEALLASIPQNAFEHAPDFEASRKGQPAPSVGTKRIRVPRLLSSSADIVFSTQKDTFDPGTAIRYALLQVLRREIDHDHELSMLYDFDLIRLRLYLLLWMPLGRRHEGSIEQIWTVVRQMPQDRIPDQIRANFTPEEIIDLLTTIALAGYHSQQSEIIDWARTRFELLLEHHAPKGEAKTAVKRQRFLAQAVRIYCSVIDSRIQTGGTPSPGLSEEPAVEDTHHETLARLRGWLSEDYADYEAAAHRPENLTKHAVQDYPAFQRCKAWMRLKAREAELLSLLQTPAGYKRERQEIIEAHGIYNSLATLEDAIAQPQTSKRPIIFSGRTARRYIKFLLRSDDYVFGDTNSEQREMVDGAVRSLININLARLRHYGGADQVCLYVDKSLYTYSKVTRETPTEEARRRKTDALLFAKEALRLCRQGNASQAIELEVLLVLVAQLLEEVDAMPEEDPNSANRRQRLKEAGEMIKRAKALAKGLKFLPSLGIAEYLGAYRKFVAYRVKPQGEVSNIKRDMLGELDQAKDMMRRCKDISFAREMAQLAKNIRTLPDLNR